MSSLRIGGLATGMDIDKLVSDLMNVERSRKVVGLEQDKQLALWKQESYHEVNKDIANFIVDAKSEFGITTSKSSSSLLVQPDTTFSWQKSASSSSTTVATATTTSTAQVGTYAIDVTQLANKATKVSSGKITVDGGNTNTLGEQFGFVGNVSFSIEGVKADGTTTTEDFVFNDFMDMDDIVTTINGKDLGVTAYYDSTSDRFFLNTTKSGSDQYFKFTADADGFVENKLKFGAITGTQMSGKDLTFTLGTDTITNSTNEISMYGVSIAAKSTGATTITVGTDTDTIFGKVKNFIDKYNTLIEKLNGTLAEKRYRDFKPLTSEQKDAMKEGDVTIWEAKAKSGLLKDDDSVSRMISSMRTGFYDTYYTSYTSSTVNTKGTLYQLSQIGITTGSYSTKGKLVIDETVLKEKIASNPDDVSKLLFGAPSDTNLDKDDSKLTDAQRTQKHNESGIINRMYNSVINGMKDVVDKAGAGDDSELLKSIKFNILVDFVISKGAKSDLDDELITLGNTITEKNTLLSSLESRYYRQYQRMETVINTMNQQSAWLSQQLGG